MSDNNKNEINRRKFLKVLGGGAAVTTAALVGCSDKNSSTTTKKLVEPPTDKMTYRTNPATGEKVSLLGYGCMRLPTVSKDSAREAGKTAEIDQEMVNRLTDYAIEHGVTYFDTSPAYCQGRSETSMGIALSRHKRSEYTIATKLSNFAPEQWSREKSIEMYHNSLKYLKVDYLDYMLLHGIGMGGNEKEGTTGMDVFNKRYINNGVLDFLVAEQKAGRIKNLGFSYHGDVEVFDTMLKWHDEGKYHWNFVQIQLNYVDWKHAKEVNARNTNAEYLYGELSKRGIPSVIMEPLLGGRLASVNTAATAKLKQMNPEASVASWAFRFAGSQPNVLTVLSGMTYMEHLQENLITYSPLQTLSQTELEQLEQVALLMLDKNLVQCNACQYCMPCPYGLDIPTIFTHYNKCINEGNYSKDINDENYRQARRIFLIGYDRSVPRLRQADHCTGCRKCVEHCPQRIDIPREMRKIDTYVKHLKLNG